VLQNLLLHLFQSTFNPAFGQGMTQAAMHAQILDRVFLEHNLKYPLHDFGGLAAKFQREASVISNAFYQGNVPLDLDLPHAEGPRNLYVKVCPRPAGNSHSTLVGEPSSKLLPLSMSSMLLVKTQIFIVS